MGKRGQVTIFVILGIIILVFIAFAIYVRGLYVQNQLARQAGSLVQEFTEDENIKSHMEHCIGTILKKAIEDLSLQGGVIYESQGGSEPFDRSALGKEFIKIAYQDKIYNVSFGLRNNDGVRAPIAPPAYDGANYPAPNVSIAEMNNKYKQSSLYARYDGYYGDVTLPRLCSSTGPNRVGGGGTSVGTHFTCEPFAYDQVYDQNPRTIQTELTKYLEKSIPYCINVSQYAKDYGKNITVVAKPVANITFQQRSIRTTVNYPLRIRLANKNIDQFASFTQDLDIRLKTVYEIAARILKEETKDLYFNISRDKQSILDYYDVQHMDVQILKDACGKLGYCHDESYYHDALFIIDLESALQGGRPLVFITAMENRAPVLDWIHTSADAEYHVSGVAGEEVLIEPYAIDPDEDSIQIYYSGWGETYLDKFTCDPAQAYSMAQLRACTSQSAILTDGIWSNSPPYSINGRSASMQTTNEDRGLHTLRVNVIDDSGLKDWQDVEILIYPLPEANASGWNSNTNIPPHILTLENRYCFDGRASISGSGQINNYQWTIAGQEYEGALLCFPPMPTDIDEVDNMLTQLFLPYLGSTLDAKLIVAAEGFHSVPDTWGVDVLECFTQTGNDRPYPYNAGDAYLSSTPCCVDNKFAGQGVMCYSESAIGPYWKLSPKESTNGNPPKAFPNAVPSFTPNKAGENDIYQIQFERYCSGNRGNTCTGAGSMNYAIIEACADITSMGQTERCSGPNPSGTACINYGNMKSFEEDYARPDYLGQIANGICNENYACSTTTVYASTEPGVPKPFFCQATCGSGLCNAPAPGTCTCNKDICGARCDSEQDVLWEDNACFYGCLSSSTCDFAANCQTKCPKGQTYCLNTNDKQCYTDVGCGPIYETGLIPCKETAGEYCPPEGSLEHDICYYGSRTCSSDGVCALQTEYCPQGGTLRDDLCYYGSQDCDPSGGCALTIEAEPNCPEGQSASCTGTGWHCN